MGVGEVGREKGLGQVWDFSSDDTMVYLHSLKTVLFLGVCGGCIYMQRKLVKAGDSFLILT